MNSLSVETAKIPTDVLASAAELAAAAGSLLELELESLLLCFVPTTAPTTTATTTMTATGIPNLTHGLVPFFGC